MRYAFENRESRGGSPAPAGWNPKKWLRLWVFPKEWSLRYWTERKDCPKRWWETLHRILTCNRKRSTDPIHLLLKSIRNIDMLIWWILRKRSSQRVIDLRAKAPSQIDPRPFNSKYFSTACIESLFGSVLGVAFFAWLLFHSPYAERWFWSRSPSHP